MESERFQKWKAKVELHLEAMIKKSTLELPYYDYHNDFKSNVPPNITAGRIIQRAYQNRRRKW